MYREEPRHRIPRWLFWPGVVVLEMVAIGAIAWMAGALYVDLPTQETSRKVLAIIWLLFALVLWRVVQPRWQARLSVVVAFALLCVWWFRLQPRQERDWKPEVLNLASAELDGEKVTVHNVRNFTYRTNAADFAPAWETRSYNLANLRALDLFLCYGESTWVAHPIFSFDFGSQGRLCFSTEPRPQVGDVFSMLGCFYRRYELICIAADEKDVVRSRSAFTSDDQVYLYRLKLTPEEVRTRFMEYLSRIDELHEKPAWYNAITDHCTTSIRAQHPAAQRLPWDWRMLLNGKMDGMLYGMGLLDHSQSFDELKKNSLINDRAKATPSASDFSKQIRTGMPGMD